MTAVLRARVRRPLLTAAVALLPAVLAVGCSSSGSGTSGSSTPAASVPSSAPAATSAASTPSAPSPTAAAGALTGKWNGSYGGVATGTFQLTWVESSGKLTGTIDLSTSGKVPLNGTVSGSTITFGTVGVAAVTYNGTVSGDTMSGTYTVGNAGTGTWSAHRA